MTIEQNEQLCRDIGSNEDLIEFERKLLSAWQFAVDKKLPLMCCLNIFETQLAHERLLVLQQALAKQPEHTQQLQEKSL